MIHYIIEVTTGDEAGADTTISGWARLFGAGDHNDTGVRKLLKIKSDDTTEMMFQSGKVLT